jgi:hypothetical protein
MPRINRSPVSNARDVSLDTSPNPDPSTVAPASHPPSSGDGIDLGESSTDVSPAVPRGVGAPSVSSSGPGVLRHTLEARMSGPEAPPAPEVKALLDQYGIQERLGRPRERIVSWAAKVQEGFEAAAAGSADPSQIADQLLAHDVRLQVFYLEGILKLYRKRFPNAADAQYREVKALEDALGQASGARSILKMAESHDGVPDKALVWLRSEVKRNDAQLTALIQEKWMPDADGQLPALGDVLHFLQDTPWDDYTADRAYLQKELGRRLKKFSKVDFDMNLLQGDTGVHELRRQLRWLPIYAVALDGLVALDGTRNPVPEYEPLLQNRDLVESKYAKLPASHRESDPLLFSHSLYLRNSQLIGELGGLKDEGEEIEGVAFALEGAHLVHDPADAMQHAKDILGLAPDADAHVFARSGQILDEMNRVDFIKSMRNELKDQ